MNNRQELILFEYFKYTVPNAVIAIMKDKLEFWSCCTAIFHDKITISGAGIQSI